MIIDDKLIAEITEKAWASERKRMNFNLHESLDAKAQRLLNVLLPGTVLPVHRHRHTAETYILLSGKLNVVFYDDAGKELERFHLDPRDCNFGVHIPKGQWHGIEVLEPATIFEVKDGPYIPTAPEDMLVLPD